MTSLYDEEANNNSDAEHASNVYCSSCDTPLQSDEAVCSDCGSADRPTAPANTTVLLIISVFNTVCCCLPLGLIAMILTLTASSATPEEADKRLRYAKYANIAGIGLGILIVIAYVVLVLSFAVMPISL